jgi:hypothetical protein
MRQALKPQDHSTHRSTWQKTPMAELHDERLRGKRIMPPPLTAKRVKGTISRTSPCNRGVESRGPKEEASWLFRK